MAWLDDLTSAMGVPAGAATIAVAMYAGCTAAEKAARPEALHDIGQILQKSVSSYSGRPAADVIEAVFIWTFGPKHLIDIGNHRSRECRNHNRSFEDWF